MIVGKVVGSVVSTRKCEKLIGSKFMIIEPVHHMKAGSTIMNLFPISFSLFRVETMLPTTLPTII